MYSPVPPIPSQGVEVTYGCDAKPVLMGSTTNDNPKRTDLGLAAGEVISKVQMQDAG